MFKKWCELRHSCEWHSVQHDVRGRATLLRTASTLAVSLTASLTALMAGGLSLNSAAIAAPEPSSPIAQRFQGWDTGVRMFRQLDNQGQLRGIGIQLELLDKPETTYANAVYQLFVRRNNRWEELFTNTGARLIPNTSGSLLLAPEFISTEQLEEKLAGTGEKISDFELQAVVQVKYDLPNGEKNRTIRSEQSQLFDTIAITDRNRGSEAQAGGYQTPTIYSSSSQSSSIYRSSQGSVSTTTQSGNSTLNSRANSSQFPLPPEGSFNGVTAVPGAEIGGPNNIQSANRGHFSLAVLQNRQQAAPVVARVSLRSKRVNGFLSERFVGDFLYEANSRVRFVRGSNPDDRVVVRLFDRQNRLLGYSEFELLPDNAAVSLILPETNQDNGLIRTVSGIDANLDGIIDRGAIVYDYLTRIDLLPSQSLSEARATFLSDNRNINLDLVNIGSIPYPPRSGSYAESLRTGSFSIVNRSVPVFSTELSPALIVLPNQLVPLISFRSTGIPTYEITRQILSYSEVNLNQSPNQTQNRTVFQP